MGFSLALPMKRYLTQIKTLQGKKVATFVTKHLPFMTFLRSFSGGGLSSMLAIRCVIQQH